MFDSYKLTRSKILADPIQEMRRIKHKQIEYLYKLAPDREEALLNGNSFKQSPRIFEKKNKDEVHYKISVETRLEDDRFGCGDELYYNGEYWLCLESYVFHDMYCKGTFQKCNWEAYWIDVDGNIQSQWCVNINTTQYNSGEFSDRYMTVGSTQHQLKMQCNKNTLRLSSPTRIFLDKNMENPTCYKVTQNDNSSYDYGDKGLCVITVYEHGKNTEKDKLVTLDNGKQVWIADYFETSNLDDTDNSADKKEILSEIKYKFSNVYIGKKATFTAVFKDTDGNVVDKTPVWNIDSNFNDSIIIEETDSIISILIKNNSLEGESFLLSLSADDDTSSTSSLRVYIDSLT